MADLRIEAEWLLGDRGLQTDSRPLGWQSPRTTLPWYGRIRRGRIDPLSNDSQRQDSIGVGWRFNRP